MVDYRFVQVNEFQANNPGWNTFGNATVTKVSNTQWQLTSANANQPSLMLYILGPAAFRVRFNPDQNYDFSTDNSLAVVNRDLGLKNLTVKSTQSDSQLQLDIGYLVLVIDLAPYRLSVYRPNTHGTGPNGWQLIHRDIPGSGTDYLGRENKNIMWAEDGSSVANLKQFPANAQYVGFGEKAGTQLVKNSYTMTFFNFNNYEYGSPGVIPPGNQGGPLNPSDPLYNSMPLTIENNLTPDGDYLGDSYSYLLFLDNVSQSYFNMGANDYSNMSGRYYFGALYGSLDYYFMAGDTTLDAIRQYQTLTGPSPLPPIWSLGFHQGAYGYFDNYKLFNIAESYRKWQIPIDGLHIDVDFQNNYRTFTNSPAKFPNVAEMFAQLKGLGFKCSTNITGMVTANPYDENGQTSTPYTTAIEGREKGYFLTDHYAGGEDSNNFFIAKEDYGQNFGSNPFSYPVPGADYYQNEAPLKNPELPAPLTPTQVMSQTLQANEPYSVINLGTSGYYPDLGQDAASEWWGQQYQYLIEAGLEMVWQDMTCPAMAGNFDNQDGNYIQTLPLNLNMTYFGEKRPNAEVHNAFALMLIRATYQGLLKLQGDKRPFIIGRGGYAGVHRYAAIWTGDSASSWDFLRINVPEVLNFGLSGVPISGCDIGGFGPGSGCVPFDNGESGTGTPYVVGGLIKGGVTNYELFTRWVTMGAFLPWFRIHYDGYNKEFQEPFYYGSPVPENCRLFIRIRYRLIQMFYDAMYENTQSGLPIARALFLNFPADKNVYGQSGYWLWTEFMVGDSLLVAPIMDPDNEGGSKRDIYLPMGSNGQTQWYAFTNDQAPLGAPVSGGTVVHGFYAPIENQNLYQVPIYVKAGAIIPTQDVAQYIDPESPNPITLSVYPGENSSYNLYQDDGLTRAYQSGQYRLTKISHQGITNGQQILIQPLITTFSPLVNYYFISLPGTKLPSEVTVDGNVIPNLVRSTPEAAADALADSSVDAYYWNANIKTTFVKVFFGNQDIQVNAFF
ncbi:glycoside hydrolase family 31 protein [Vibrio mangrovi]|uniref:Alpha-xylosidase n=1 Tax=Vibrio mangrovi TaxID=474394 RepID=A0A1Y6ISW5_9VIBR|nr:TIM-barrel domain-containing protein [Vibrio mangrovi]MDW6004029.1 glycoside hydrolase family 31 protein [Vibrio mangrovi]SMR99173.1 Alpha-xylosidase [Vibrio mangrovi]